MPDKPPASSESTSLGQRAAGGLLAAHDQAWKPIAKTMLKDAPRATRFVLQRIPGAPGLIYDGATFATADDKLRAGLGLAGGVALGGVGGLVAGPLGAAAGSMAGEAGAEWLYDNRRKIADTSQWIKDRTARLADRTTHAFDRGMPPYSAPLR